MKFQVFLVFLAVVLIFNFTSRCGDFPLDETTFNVLNLTKAERGGEVLLGNWEPLEVERDQGGL